jgi:hypothetical protein
VPSDDDWDVPTDVTTAPTWIVAAENARHEQATLAAIERAQLRDLAPRPPTQPPEPARPAK